MNQAEFILTAGGIVTAAVIITYLLLLLLIRVVTGVYDRRSLQSLNRAMVKATFLIYVAFALIMLAAASFFNPVAAEPWVDRCKSGADKHRKEQCASMQ